MINNNYLFNSKNINGQSLIHLINLCLPKKSIVVEIGAWFGQTSCMIAQNCDNVSKIYAVDPYLPFLNSFTNTFVDEKELDYAKNIAIHNIKYSGVSKKIELVKKNSLEFAKNIKDNSIDLIFLDAETSSDALDKDLRAWYPKLKTGGIFSGHDWEDVKDAVFMFKKDKNISVYDNVWAWMKK